LREKSNLLKKKYSKYPKYCSVYDECIEKQLTDCIVIIFFPKKMTNFPTKWQNRDPILCIGDAAVFMYIIIYNLVGWCATRIETKTMPITRLKITSVLTRVHVSICTKARLKIAIAGKA
jgi:hypothetical protein